MTKLILKNEHDIDNFMKDIDVIITPEAIETISSIDTKISFDKDGITLGVLEFDMFGASIMDNLSDTLKATLKIDEVWLFVKYEVIYSSLIAKEVI